MLEFLSIATRPFVYILLALTGGIVFMRLIRLPLQREACVVYRLDRIDGSGVLWRSLSCLRGCRCCRLRSAQPALPITSAINLHSAASSDAAESIHDSGNFGINYLFDLDHQRVLTLALLLPALLMMSKTPHDSKPLVRNGVDFFFFIYVVWLVLMGLLHRPSPTDKLRAVFDACDIPAHSLPGDEPPYSHQRKT